MYVLLSDHCDAYTGISYTDGGYADWTTMTRSYVRYRSILVTNQPERLQDDTLGCVIEDSTIPAALPPADRPARLNASGH